MKKSGRKRKLLEFQQKLGRILPFSHEIILGVEYA